MSIIGPYGYSGGYNPDASLLTIPKGQLSALTNMVTNQGQLIPTAGYDNASITQPPSLSDDYIGLVGFNLSGNNYLLLCTHINGFYQLENFTGSWSSVGGSGTVNAASALCVETLNSVMTVGAMTNATSSFAASGIAYQSTGGSLGAFSGPSGFGVFKVVNNILFGLHPNGTVYWSAVQDSTTWPATNSLTFRFGDGDLGVALGKIGTTLYIFKLGSMGALQTQSVVIAGAVTLGPLYPVFDKIGTFSMRSIDNLPTGELVFIGTDYNIYKFDGSNLTNLSNRPYPQSSVQGLINSFLKTNAAQLIPPNLNWLRVNPNLNAIYFVIGGSEGYQQNSPQLVLAYDYVKDYWYQPAYGFGDFVYAYTVGNFVSALTVSQYEIVLNNYASTSTPSICSLSSIYTTFQGSPISGQAVVSIPYTFESRDTIPRSALVAYQVNAADTISFTQGADGVYGSAITPTPTGNFQRTVLPFNFIDSTMSAQVEINTSTSNTFSINPLVLDTEMAH